MQVTCLYCGLATEISPEQHRCRECGGDLEALVTPEYAAQFYYDKASAAALAGQDRVALAEIQHGLSEHDSPELHLLAAIIHKRQGQVDPMRAHVAAIPVGDSLRPEGEWLLRSQQGRTARASGQPRELTVTPFGGPESRATAGEKARGRALWLAPALILLLLVGLWGWQAGVLNFNTAPVADGGQTEPAQAAVSGDAQANAPEAPAQTENSVDAVAQPAPTPQPTATVPKDLAQLPAGSPATVAQESPLVTAEPIALAGGSEQAAVRNVLNLVESKKFDLSSLLEAAGATDLAQLSVTATRSSNQILLTGSVETAAQRARLIALARSVPDVAEVDAINLVLRVPKVYRVKSGDTLWTIADEVYGDGSRWQEIFDQNQAILDNNPNNLWTDLELELPAN